MKADELKRALLTVPPLERDAWVNARLGLDELPDDSAELPRDGVPYLPASVDSLLRFVELARLGPDDVIVDVGSGVGRAAWVLHVLTGARVIGIEIQRALVRDLEGVTFLTGDASLTHPPEASAYFLYCPFSGATLERWLDGLPNTPLVIGCVDFTLPARTWLTQLAADRDVTLYRANENVKNRE